MGKTERMVDMAGTEGRYINPHSIPKGERRGMRKRGGERDVFERGKKVQAQQK
jgi:hypothetical protein